MRPAVFDGIVVGIVCAECGECHRNPLRRLRDDREFICDNCGLKITLKNELLGTDSQKFAKIRDHLRRPSDNPEKTH
jgi:DNA-directed RNA polymerase subunit RPC12/RpoP